MKHRSPVSVAFGLALSLTVIGLAGCAQSRPCVIIPAQIELARQKRDQAREEYERKLSEVTRAHNNIEVSTSRLDRLREERDELGDLLGETPEGGN